MSRKSTFTFKSTENGIDVHAVTWLPEGEVQGIVQICHGMVEFIDRYEEFAEYLNERNILVVGHDLLGHGDTAVKKEDLGFFSNWGGNGKLVSDIFRLKGIVKRDYPSVPYFMLGHSFGSLLLREYVMRFKDDLDGIVLAGTMNPSNIEVLYGSILAKIIGLVRGKHFRSGILNYLAVGKNNGRFKEEGRNSWLTRDKEVVKWFNKEPLCNFVFTVGAYQDMFEALSEVNKAENIINVDKNLPILMLSGDKDPVGRQGKAVKKLFNVYKNIGLNVKIKLYKDYRHEILNEINNKQVYEDIYRWICKYIV